MLNATPTPITPPRVPLIDPRTGLIDRAWYMFFLSLFQAAQIGGDPAPNASSLIASYDAALAAVAQEAQTLPVQQQIIPQDVAEPSHVQYVPQDVADPARADSEAELNALRQELQTLPPSVDLPHNSLQGLNDGDYKHLTAAEYTGTGTGVFVRKTSPALVTPILGTPQSGDFSTGTFTWPIFNQSTTGNAAKLATSPNTYSFSGVNVTSGANAGIYSGALPTGTGTSTNEWLEVIIDTTSYWLPIWVK